MLEMGGRGVVLGTYRVSSWSLLKPKVGVSEGIVRELSGLQSVR